MDDESLGGNIIVLDLNVAGKIKYAVTIKKRLHTDVNSRMKNLALHKTCIFIARVVDPGAIEDSLWFRMHLLFIPPLPQYTD